MRKAVVLLIGILLLGGMMGMVSAFTPTIDGSPTDWAITPSAITEESYDYQGDIWVWHDDETDVSDLSSNVRVLAITADSDYIYFLVNTSDVSSTQMLIIIDADNNATTGKTDFTYFGSVNMAFGANLVSDRGYEIAIRIDSPNDAVSILNGVDESAMTLGDSWAKGSVIEIAVPRSVFSSYGTNWQISFATIDSASNPQDTMGSYSYLGGVYHVSIFNPVDISQVPFFSNVALALLLALVAVWFFKRK